MGDIVSYRNLPVKRTNAIISPMLEIPNPTPAEVTAKPDSDFELKFKQYWANMGCNPLYKEDQRGVLDRLKVGPVEEVLPSHMRQDYDENISLIGLKTIKTKSGPIHKLHGLSNDLLTIVRLRKRPQNRYFLFNPIYEVEDYYLIDRKNGKAFDMKQLWKLPESVQPQEGNRVLTIYRPFTDHSFLRFEDDDKSVGGMLFLNSFFEREYYKQGWWKLDQRETEAVDVITPIHEAAHRWQLFRCSKEQRNMEAEKHRKLLQLASFLRLGRLLGLQERIRLYKQFKVELERNAHAFSLSATRVLRDQGIDIFRDFSLSQIEKIVDFPLSTYEKLYTNILGMGLPYFTQERKRENSTKILKKRTSFS